jgi:hypothetical protein
MADLIEDVDFWGGPPGAWYLPNASATLRQDRSLVVVREQLLVASVLAGLSFEFEAGEAISKYVCGGLGREYGLLRVGEYVCRDGLLRVLGLFQTQYDWGQQPKIPLIHRSISLLDDIARADERVQFRVESPRFGLDSAPGDVSKVMAALRSLPRNVLVLKTPPGVGRLATRELKGV